MARTVTCDVCKRPTTEIAHKILLAPPPRKGKAMQSEYTHHGDVGICCQGRIKQIVDFRERRTRAEYNEARRKQAGMKKTLEVVKRGDSVASRKAS